jgi:hypothetical protein
MTYEGGTDPDGRNEPATRKLHFSSKGNSEFKWKHDKTVVGALEVEAEPILDVRAKMTEHVVESYEDEFAECLRLWGELDLRQQFIKEWENIPPQTSCCGLINNYDETIKYNTPHLNDGWVKSVNENYLAEKGYKMSIFVWSWSNPTGKAETVIPMIRFHALKLTKPSK